MQLGSCFMYCVTVVWVAINIIISKHLSDLCGWYLIREFLLYQQFGLRYSYSIWKIYSTLCLYQCLTVIQRHMVILASILSPWCFIYSFSLLVISWLKKKQAMFSLPLDDNILAEYLIQKWITISMRISSAPSTALTSLSFSSVIGSKAASRFPGVRSVSVVVAICMGPPEPLPPVPNLGPPGSAWTPWPCRQHEWMVLK